MVIYYLVKQGHLGWLGFNMQLLFPTPIHEVELEFNNKELASEVYEIKDKYPQSGTDWRCNTYSTFSLNTVEKIKNKESLDALLHLITAEVIKYLNNLSVDMDTFGVGVRELWLNLSKKGDFQEYHQHSGNDVSAVYFLQGEEGSGNLVLKSMESMSEKPLPFKENTLPNSTTYEIKPKPGRLVIFRSHVPHMVQENKSSDRVSMALNLGLFQK